MDANDLDDDALAAMQRNLAWTGQGAEEQVHPTKVRLKPASAFWHAYKHTCCFPAMLQTSYIHTQHMRHATQYAFLRQCLCWVNKICALRSCCHMLCAG